MNGKGSTARPLSVSRDEFARRWDETFGTYDPYDSLRYAPSDWVAAAEDAMRIVPFDALLYSDERR